VREAYPQTPRRRGAAYAIADTPLTMSEQTVAIVREALETFDTGDLERLYSLMHPDFEGHVSPELSAEPDTYRGREGIRRYFDSFREAFDEIRFHVEQLEDAGDAVVVGLRMTATGRLTGIIVEQRNAGVWTVLDGKLARIDTYATFADAQAAAHTGGSEKAAGR
jgi:ketosteroid isomerase-like protein